ncbi:unnamed protein product, partial [Tuber aestivum]
MFAVRGREPRWLIHTVPIDAQYLPHLCWSTANSTCNILLYRVHSKGIVRHRTLLVLVRAIAALVSALLFLLSLSLPPTPRGFPVQALFCAVATLPVVQHKQSITLNHEYNAFSCCTLRTLDRIEQKVGSISKLMMASIPQLVHPSMATIVSPQ